MTVYEVGTSDPNGYYGGELFLTKEKALESQRDNAEEINEEYFNPIHGAPYDEKWRYIRQEMKGVVEYKNCAESIVVRKRAVY